MRRLSLLMLIYAALTGCAANDAFVQRQSSMEGRLEQIMQAQNSTKAELAELSLQLKELKSQVAKQAASGNDAKPQYELLQEQLRTLGNRLEQVESSRRTSVIELVNQESLPEGREESVQAAYMKAFGLFSANSFKAAAVAFEAFIASYPESEYASNARYWLAECLYSEERYKEAIDSFTKVLESKPSEKRGSDAMVKIGLAWYKLKDQEKGDVLPAFPEAFGAGYPLNLKDLESKQHFTQPPPRYSEATLIKSLDELGIGRPSTWASIMQTIVNRGYVWKKGQALVPNWVAFSVINLLVKHFSGLVDYSFTANTEEDLDAIAQGLQKKEQWLTDFYFGNKEGRVGLKQRVAINLDEIDASAINTFPVGIDPKTGLEVVVKPGKFGPYVRRGEETASVPDTMTPDELTLEAALKLLAAPKGTDPIGEIDGLPLFIKSGRYGTYIQWGTPDAPPPGLDKPKMVSLFKTMDPAHITLPDAARLLSLPRVVGVDPADGAAITAQNGRYGPYITKGKESRTLADEEQIFSITVEQALALLAAPRQFGRRAAPRPPLRELGNDPVSGKPVMAKEGKFGVYVTDGETNASLTRSDRLDEMMPERAYELLAIRRENAGNGAGRKKRTPSKKAAKKPSRKKASLTSGSPAKS